MVTLAAARVISADSIKVHGIVIANTSQAAVTVIFEDSANTAVMTVEVPANNTHNVEILWLADNGLGIRIVNANVIVTVFHGQSGA